MIKIQNVIKDGDYYQIVLTEGLTCVGILLGVLEDRLDMEFMTFDPKDPNEIILITEEDNPDEYTRMKEKYFDTIMEYVKNNSN